MGIVRTVAVPSLISIFAPVQSASAPPTLIWNGIVESVGRTYVEPLPGDARSTVCEEGGVHPSVNGSERSPSRGPPSADVQSYTPRTRNSYDAGLAPTVSGTVIGSET